LTCGYRPPTVGQSWGKSILAAAQAAAAIAVLHPVLLEVVGVERPTASRRARIYLMAFGTW